MAGRGHVRGAYSQMGSACRARPDHLDGLRRELISAEIPPSILGPRRTLVQREDLVSRLLVDILELGHQGLEIAHAVLAAGAGRVDQLSEQ